MSLTGECFDKVFGLSRETNACYATYPAGYSESASGLYLDETPGLNLKRIMGSVETTAELWTLMENARVEGVKRFTSETVKHLQANAAWTRKPMSATIGSIDNGSGTVTTPNTYHGMDVVVPNHIGGQAILKRVGMYVKFTGSVNVHLYEEGNDTPLTTFVVSAVANRLTWTDVGPIGLDMEADGMTYKRYWLLWEPAGREALNSRIHCGCSGTPVWNCEHPWWVVPPSKAQDWYTWAMANGTYGSTLSDRVNWAHSNATQGMLLGFDFKCDGRTTLCTGTPDYDTDVFQSTFAYGSRFAAALYLVEHMTGSTRVNRDNIVNGDQLELMRVGYAKEINERAEWLGMELAKPENVKTYSDCFTCADESGLMVQTIRR